MVKIINDKFRLLNESLIAMSKGNINILTLYGSPGTGKTHTTLKDLQEQNINYEYVNSYATPLSFYELLYNNRSKDVIVFDDICGINNPLVISILKAACWTSDGAKIVSYHSTSNKMDLHGLPESFEFSPRIVLIFNKLPKDYESIINRGVAINFNFNFNEKIEIFEGLGDVIDKDVLDYVKMNCDESTTNLNLRSLVILSDIKRGGQDFKLFTKEMLKPDEDKKLLIQLSAVEWSDATGMHKRTYYRRKKKLK